MIYLPPTKALPNWPWELIRQRFSARHHGDYPRWSNALDHLPDITTPARVYQETVSVSGCTDDTLLEQTLQQLHPWRKGPFRLANVSIDSEWRSDWKWSRIAPHIDLQGHQVLDIGCGNGYFGWRMLEAGAREVVGVDPTLLFCIQHQVLMRYCQDFRNWVLPLKAEELPTDTTFDSVFSMGVLYHRRDPLGHLRQLCALTQPGGQVILETLVHEGEQSLIPAGRYARMRNVWCVPTITQLKCWMQDSGLSDLVVLDVSPTSIAEQRSTPWMTFESLAEALDPHDPNLTVEGHPAPVRAVLRGVRR